MVENKFFSKMKSAKKDDCCSVTIEEVKKDESCCGESKEKSADSNKS